MDDKNHFQEIRATARAALVARNRDERRNELEALKVQTENMSHATIYDPEDWDFYHTAKSRIKALRQFLNPSKPHF